MVNNYNGNNFNELTQERVLVDFYANWCGPCKMLGPVLEKVSDEIKVLKVNVDEYQDLAREYGVMSIPCIILFEEFFITSGANLLGICSATITPCP